MSMLRRLLLTTNKTTSPLSLMRTTPTLTPPTMTSLASFSSLSSFWGNQGMMQQQQQARQQEQQQQQQHVARSFVTSTTPNQMPLDEFRDPVSRQDRMMTELVGRSWSVRELRRKSYDDLHKLWYVLYKERNMLLTEQQLSRRNDLRFPQPDRIQKVKKSMGAIKHVLGERKRQRLAEVKQEKLMQKAQELKAGEEGEGEESAVQSKEEEADDGSDKQNK